MCFPFRRTQVRKPENRIADGIADGITYPIAYQIAYVFIPQTSVAEEAFLLILYIINLGIWNCSYPFGVVRCRLHN